MSGRARFSRRSFLASLPAAATLAAQTSGKGKTFPSAIKRYSDPTTEFPIARLTDPAHSSFLPPAYSRPLSRRGNFLLYASDMTGRFEVFRMDVKSGQSRQLTEAANLDPHSVALEPGEHGFFHLDGNQLVFTNFSNLRSRVVYEIPDGFSPGRGLGIAEDGQHAALIEKKDEHRRLQLIQIATGEPSTIAECDEDMRDPVPRPRRASILYGRGGAAWLANYDGKQNYRLRLADGQTGPALWSPDGREILYLNFPADTHKLRNLREFLSDSNEDRPIADTSQFVQFDRNADASVFVGASASKASPYVLLLVRAVKRELTLAEHRASDPAMVSPLFAWNSQRVYFVSDRHGKPAIYTMSVERFVEETDGNP